MLETDPLEWTNYNRVGSGMVNCMLKDASCVANSMLNKLFLLLHMKCSYFILGYPKFEAIL